MQCNIDPWAPALLREQPGLLGPMFLAQLWTGFQCSKVTWTITLSLKPHLGGTLQFNLSPNLCLESPAILPQWTLTEEYKIRKVIINQITKEVTPQSPFRKIRFCSHHTCPKRVRLWRIHFHTPDSEETRSFDERSDHLEKEQETQT